MIYATTQVGWKVVAKVKRPCYPML